MRKPSMRFGTTRQPGLLSHASDEFMSDDRQEASQNWNMQAALASLQQQREKLAQADLTLATQTQQNANRANTETARVALATALGGSKNTPLTFGQLQAHYYQLPEDEQARIYAGGGAHFIDPDTGAKLLKGVADTRDKAVQSQISTIANRLARGDIRFERDANGKPMPYEFSSSVDPNDPEGQKMVHRKVPLNSAAMGLLAQGIKRGLISDPSQANNALPVSEGMKQASDANPNANSGQRVALNAALGNGMIGTPPTYDRLKGEFYSRPLAERADIYKNGGAPFEDAETGQKLIESGSKERDRLQHEGIGGIVNQLSKGEIQFENDDKGVPRPYSYEIDPNASPADVALGKNKKKTPLSPIQLTYLNEGMKQGMIPDIDQFRTAPKTVAPTQVPSGQAATVAALQSSKSVTDTAYQQDIESGLSPAAAKIRQTARNIPSEVSRAAYNGGALIKNAVSDVGNAYTGVRNSVAGTASMLAQAVTGSPGEMFPQRGYFGSVPYSFDDYHPERPTDSGAPTAAPRVTPVAFRGTPTVSEPVAKQILPDSAKNYDGTNWDTAIPSGGLEDGSGNIFDTARMAASKALGKPTYFDPGVTKRLEDAGRPYVEPAANPYGAPFNNGLVNSQPVLPSHGADNLSPAMRRIIQTRFPSQTSEIVADPNYTNAPSAPMLPAAPLLAPPQDFGVYPSHGATNSLTPEMLEIIRRRKLQAQGDVPQFIAPSDYQPF